MKTVRRVSNIGDNVVYNFFKNKAEFINWATVNFTKESWLDTIIIRYNTNVEEELAYFGEDATHICLDEVKDAIVENFQQWRTHSLYLHGRISG